MKRGKRAPYEPLTDDELEDLVTLFERLLLEVRDLRREVRRRDVLLAKAHHALREQLEES